MVSEIPILMCWSGGKDSAMALQALVDDARFDVVALLTTVNQEYQRISMHGVRRELLERQSEAIGLPLSVVEVPNFPSNTVYEEAMRAALLAWKEKGVSTIAFGDLFLEDVRTYREALTQPLGFDTVYPLWGMPTDFLARQCIQRGFKARLCCVDSARLNASFAGRIYDEALLADLPEGVDRCAENGEFHTFVYDGPIFRHGVACVPGETVLRDNFTYLDLLAA